MSATRKSGNSSSTSSGTPAAGQIGESINSVLSSADAAAAQSVQALSLIHQARVTQLTRTAANLKAQFGANDAGVKSAEAAVTASASTAARVAMVHQELTTAAPQVPENGIALHGRVYDASGAPLPNMTVFLVDETNTYQQQFGFSYTDETGYFLVNVADSNALSANAKAIFLEVADIKSRPVYLSPSLSGTALSGELYQKIVLPPGAKPIGDPPKAIRGSAIPTKKTKT
jgi:hypothetical protein